MATPLANLNNHNYTNRIGGAQLIPREDKRGKTPPKHAASEEELDVLRKHIFSFPREQSHYTLSKKETLNPSLDVKQMHTLYQQQEEENERRALGYGGT